MSALSPSPVVIPPEEATPSPLTWEERNRAYLLHALSRVRRALERHIALASRATAAREADDDAEASARAADAGDADLSSALPWPADMPPPALDALCGALTLSAFERDVLLMCAGVELDSTWSRLIARAQGDDRQTAPTFGLALAALPGAHWSALAPNRSLRFWRLVEADAHASLTTAALRIDEAILHGLAGVPVMDAFLLTHLHPIGGTTELFASHVEPMTDIVQLWRGHERTGASPIIELVGRHPTDAEAVAGAACAELRLGLFSIDSADIPTALHDREWLARIWQREAWLHRMALLVRVDARGAAAAASFVASLAGYVFVTGEFARSDGGRAFARVTVDSAPPAVREARWRAVLGPAASRAEDIIGSVAAEFDFSASDIDATARQVRADDDQDAAAPLDRALWRAAQSASRVRLEGLAQRIEPRAGWAALVLPAPHLETLRLVAAHLRHRGRVYDDWGFAEDSTRGLGITALFSGTSGTGKTLAAEVLARELSYELYRIDLSQVVSKYIGETEKNLKRLFDAAEAGGTILLFDEADALFGRRSEVRDSHDRYANLEISYLLQRMEAFRGLAILTTNMKNSLDPAFLRRLRFVVQFPFPDGAQRAEIWRRVFPQDTPIDGLDIARLARLNVAGGNIRNIALNAAFLAAETGEPVRMAHVLRAARSEYAKLERALTDAEIAGWV